MHKKKVCILEDDPDILEMISYVLTDAGYSVAECSTIAEFREYILQEVPDLFVLDVLLPDGNGMNVCKELKANPLTSTVPVLLMSANLSRHVVLRIAAQPTLLVSLLI